MQRVHRLSIVSAAFGCAALMLGTPRALAQAAPSPAPASPDVASSERHAARAFEAYERKDHASAIALYQQALEAAPSADIVYNIARVYDIGLRDRARAIEFYARYVDEPGAVPARIEIANARIAELRAAQLAALAVPAPATAVRAAAVAPEPRLLPPEARREPSPALTTGAVLAGSLGLVGIGLGVGFGLAAKSDLEESERYCNGNQCTSQIGVEAAKDASRAADIATAGFAAGGTLLALGAVLWLVSDAGSEPSALSPEVAWTPRVGPKELSLALSGSFGGP